MTTSLSTSPLGRPRTFVPEEVLGLALDTFWRQGYRATSLDDLTAIMGLSRSSFYAAFGSKQEVLLASVRAYVDGIYTSLESCSSEHAHPIEAVRAMLVIMTTPARDERGCLLVNSIAELAPEIPELADLAQMHIERVVALIALMLTKARFNASIVRSRAAALMACAFGAAIMRKAGIAADSLAPMLAEIESLLQSPKQKIARTRQ